MSLNQYAVYQLKVDDSTRPLRNKSYKHVLEKHITVVSDNPYCYISHGVVVKIGFKGNRTLEECLKTCLAMEA